MEGATERDIVYGGLEEVMSTATKEVIAMSEKLDTDLRTAAYALAITRLNDYYLGSGLIAWGYDLSYFIHTIIEYFLPTIKISFIKYACIIGTK